MNAIGVISMSYARPFTAAHFPRFSRMKAAGMDSCEQLVPEPGELDPAAMARAHDARLFLQLAARVNVRRDLLSDDAAPRAAGVDECDAVPTLLSHAARPLYGSPLVFAGRAPAPIYDAPCRERVKRVTDGLRAPAEHAEGSCRAAQSIRD
jgi:D-psicose/D-tagatose/L-ribulose 3-epimerase